MYASAILKVIKVKGPLLGLTLLAAAGVFLIACAANPTPSAVPALAGGTVVPSAHSTTSSPTSTPTLVPTASSLPTTSTPTISPPTSTPVFVSSPPVPTITWTLVPTDVIPRNAIAFSSNMRTGGADFDIWLVQVDGSGLSMLPTGSCDPSDDSRSEKKPAWSPDGRKLAFISEPSRHDEPQFVCVLDFERGITSAFPKSLSIYAFSWAPDSRHLVYTTLEGLSVADLDHRDHPRLFHRVPSDRVAWAPDGLKIGVGRGKWESDDPTRFEIVGLDGTLFKYQDLGAGAGIVEDISWSPDGKYALVSYRASRWGGYLALFEVDVESQSYSWKKSINDFGQYPDGPDYCQSSWSPDGKQIVFVSGAPSCSGECAGYLYAADADLSNISLFIQGDDLFQSPSWSPDGRFVLFTKTRQVRDQGEECFSLGPSESIWLINSDGTDLGRLVGGDGYEYSRPVWQPLLQEP